VDIYDGKVLIDSINLLALPIVQFPFVVGDELVSVDGTPVQTLIESFRKYAIAANQRSTDRIAAIRLVSRSQQIFLTPNGQGIGQLSGQGGLSPAVFGVGNTVAADNTLPAYMEPLHSLLDASVPKDYYSCSVSARDRRSSPCLPGSSSALAHSRRTSFSAGPTSPRTVFGSASSVFRRCRRQAWRRRCNSSIRTVAPVAGAYTHPLMVLVDEFSASGGDMFPAIIQDNNRGPLFGMRTMGAGGSVVAFNATAYTESIFRITVSLMNLGRLIQTGEFPLAPYIENIGVRPDIPFDYMTRANLMTAGAPFVQAFTQAIVTHASTSP
jgi:hypothetical protein